MDREDLEAIRDRYAGLSAHAVHALLGHIAEVEHDAAIAACEPAIREDERRKLLQLIADLTDPEPCWFDHHGGCQAHGYLEPEPGEICPHEEARQLLAASTDGEGDDDAN